MHSAARDSELPPDEQIIQKNNQNQQLKLLSGMEGSSRLSWQKLLISLCRHPWFEASYSAFPEPIEQLITEQDWPRNSPAEALPPEETNKGCCRLTVLRWLQKKPCYISTCTFHEGSEVGVPQQGQTLGRHRQECKASLFLRAVSKLHHQLRACLIPVNPKLPLCPLQVWKGKLFPPLSFPLTEGKNKNKKNYCFNLFL